MVRALAVLAATVAVVAWALRKSPIFGEWLRRLSDGPTNWVLIGTSGFEREGRDPAKAP